MKQQILCIFALFFVSVLFAESNISDSAYEAILEDASLSEYHGWLRYANHRAHRNIPGESEEVVETWKAQLQSWILRIQENPNCFEELEGTFEWAYESQADRSGQPFKVSMPLDYDPEKSYPLSLYLHGFTGDHVEHTKGMTSNAEYFQAAVLGRSRGGYYQDLSEADVMDVIQYIQDHWNVDPQRIHLNGGSMGGFGTFYISNRYPHMIASARPTCGYAGNLPLGNWKHVPFYSIHSVDDYVVPVVMSRIPMQALMDTGGSVILDETEGYGHASWDYEEGQERAGEWFPDRSAPLSEDVKHVDYTAIDGKAVKGYWGEIIEWGPVQNPARFILNIKQDNFLNVTLENIACLKVDVQNSPIDQQKDLSIAFTGLRPMRVEAPIPNELYLTVDGVEIKVEQEDPTQNMGQLRFPGGSRNLYNGEPLLIVWGTQGTEEENQLMADAALSARRSSHPKWTTEEGRGSSDIDGVRHEHNTYGLLRGKADTDVTEEELQHHHLVIIGNERQNLVARKLSSQLPLKIESGKVIANDGVVWGSDEAAVVFNYKNPFSQDHLVSWVACDDASFYQPGNALVEFAAEPAGGMDLVVYDFLTQKVLGVRNFDSRWNWEAGYSESPLIQEKPSFAQNLTELESRAAGIAANADYYLCESKSYHHDDWYDWDHIRLSDLRPYYYGKRWVSGVVTGNVLNALFEVFASEDSEASSCQLIRCKSDSDTIIEDQAYRIVTDLFALKGLMEIIQENHSDMAYVKTTPIQAMETFVLSNQ